MVRNVDQDLLLLDTTSNQIHQLNQTARFIWQRCDEAHSSEEMARWVATAYEVRYDDVLGDVVETLGKLRELNLIVDVDLSEEPATGHSGSQSASGR